MNHFSRNNPNDASLGGKYGVVDLKLKQWIGYTKLNSFIKVGYTCGTNHSRERPTKKRARRLLSNEFKEQVVKLYLAGKPRNEIIKEYELTPSAFDKWIRQH